MKDDFIILKSGIWDLTTTYLQVDKIQEVKIKQSYFQKRRSLASIKLSTFSESLRLNFYDEKLLKNLVIDLFPFPKPHFHNFSTIREFGNFIPGRCRASSGL